MTQVLTPAQLLMAITFFSGSIVSLLSIYVPYFNTWYAGVDTKWKPLLQLGFNVLGFGVIMLLSCTALAQWVPCTQQGLLDLGKQFVAMLTGNLLTYSYVTKSTEPRRVRERKSERKTEKGRVHPQNLA